MLSLLSIRERFSRQYISRNVVRRRRQPAAGTNLTASAFVFLEDTAPGGPFATMMGGLTVPMTPGIRFYIVAGNSGCGVGP
jgi:hypothetical protein